MDNEKIVSLCAVVETKSMSGAARKLFCSQPAVSKHIAALESEFGCSLFTRQGKTLALTESGRRVYAFGTRYLEDYRQLQSALYHLRLQENHCISFGATNFIGTYLIPQLLASYKERHPDRQIVFTIDFWPNLFSLLMRNEISFALAPQTDDLLAQEHLDLIPVTKDPMCLVLPPNHPLTRRRVIRPEDLLRIPLLVPQPLSATRQFVLEQLAALSLTPQHLIDLGTAQAVKQGVISGMGVAVLSRRSVRTEEKAGLVRCRDISGMPLVRALYVVKRKDRALTQEEQSWIDMLRQSDDWKQL